MSPTRYSVSHSTLFRKSRRYSARQPRNPRWISERKQARTRKRGCGGIGLMDDSGDIDCVRRVETAHDRRVTPDGTCDDVQPVSCGSSRKLRNGWDGIWVGGYVPPVQLTSCSRSSLLLSFTCFLGWFSGPIPLITRSWVI